MRQNKNNFKTDNVANLWHGDYSVRRETDGTLKVKCYMDVKLFDTDNNLISKDTYMIHLPDSVHQHFIWKYKTDFLDVVPFNNFLIEPTPTIEDAFKYVLAFPEDVPEYKYISSTWQAFQVLLYSSPSFTNPNENEWLIKGFVSKSTEDTYINNKEASLGFYFPNSVAFEADISQIMFGPALYSNSWFQYDTISYNLPTYISGTPFLSESLLSVCVPGNGYIYVTSKKEGLNYTQYDIYKYSEDNLQQKEKSASITSTTSNETLCNSMCSDGEYLYVKIDGSNIAVFDFNLNFIKLVTIPSNYSVVKIFYSSYLDRLCGMLKYNTSAIVVFNKNLTAVENSRNWFFWFPYQAVDCYNNIFYCLIDGSTNYGQYDLPRQILRLWENSPTLIIQTTYSDLYGGIGPHFPNFVLGIDISINDMEIWVLSNQNRLTKTQKFRVKTDDRNMKINIKTIHKQYNEFVKIIFRFIYPI